MFQFKIFLIGIGCIALGLWFTIASGRAEFLVMVLFGALCAGSVVWYVAYKINRDRTIVAHAQQERSAIITNAVPTSPTATSRHLFVPRKLDERR